MIFNVSRDNILRMFRNEYRDRLQAAEEVDSLNDWLDTAEAALAAVLMIVDSETKTAMDSFQQGALDSHRPSRGMTGPGVVSSQELPEDDGGYKTHRGSIARRAPVYDQDEPIV